MTDAENTTAQEIAEHQRQERVKLRADAKLMQQLVAHPAWKRYCEFVEAGGQMWLTELMRPAENMFDTAKGEYAKGTLNGLSRAVGFPELKLKEARDLLGASFDAED